MNFKSQITCDVCGKTINMPSGRLEWNYAPGEMQLVHHDCSLGWNDRWAHPLSDMIFDQTFYDNPDFVYQRLNVMKSDSPELKNAIDAVVERLFD